MSRDIFDRPMFGTPGTDERIDKTIDREGRAVRKEEDRHRSFGCPTIRKDIPYKEFRSVADY